MLDGLYPAGGPAAAERVASLEEIQMATCEPLGIAPEALSSSDRSARVAWARQVAMYLSRELTDATLPAIGRAFGGRNHTTVLHACRRATERIATDAQAHELVRNLTLSLPATTRVPTAVPDKLPTPASTRRARRVRRSSPHARPFRSL